MFQTWKCLIFKLDQSWRSIFPNLVLDRSFITRGAAKEWSSDLESIMCFLLLHILFISSSNQKWTKASLTLNLRKSGSLLHTTPPPKCSAQGSLKGSSIENLHILSQLELLVFFGDHDNECSWRIPKKRGPRVGSQWEKLAQKVKTQHQNPFYGFIICP